MKKSLYLFLSALLGMLLFLTLHRLAFFAYLMYVIVNTAYASKLDFLLFYSVDYVTAFIAVLLGAWYGIWLGHYWYELVYVQGAHKGVVHSLIYNHLLPQAPRESSNLKIRIEASKKKLEKDLDQLEGLAKQASTLASNPEPVKRKIVRKRAPKKLNTR